MLAQRSQSDNHLQILSGVTWMHTVESTYPTSILNHWERLLPITHTSRKEAIEYVVTTGDDARWVVEGLNGTWSVFNAYMYKGIVFTYLYEPCGDLFATIEQTPEDALKSVANL